MFESKKINLYIHIPFCNQKCPYCHFYSVSKRPFEEYLSLVQKELFYKVRKYNLKEYQLETIYFGGGTPSLLSAYHFNYIFQFLSYVWNIDDVKEVNLELHPSYILPEYINDLANTKINRLSFGIQSFQEKFVKYINRRHNLDHILSLLDLAKQRKFLINLDFIFALPEYEESDFYKDLEIIKELMKKDFLDHLSFYELEIWENTAMFNLKKEKADLFLEEEKLLKLYNLIHQELSKLQWEHYEISNFTLNSKYALHNLNFWKGENYLGLGPSAESKINNIILKNYPDIDKYYLMEDFYTEEKLNDIDKIVEYFVLRMRLNQEINYGFLEKGLEKELENYFVNNNLSFKNSKLKMDFNLWLKYNKHIENISSIIYDYYS